MSDNITILTTENFSEYTAQNDCLVMFFKSQCPNCKVLMKVMDKVKGMQPALNIAAVNSEECPEILEQTEASRVPTTLVYKQGELLARKVGVINPAQMLSFYQTA